MADSHSVSTDLPDSEDVDSEDVESQLSSFVNHSSSIFRYSGTMYLILSGMILLSFSMLLRSLINAVASVGIEYLCVPKALNLIFMSDSLMVVTCFVGLQERTEREGV